MYGPDTAGVGLDLRDDRSVLVVPESGLAGDYQLIQPLQRIKALVDRFREQWSKVTVGYPPVYRRPTLTTSNCILPKRANAGDVAPIIFAEMTRPDALKSFFDCPCANVYGPLVLLADCG